MVYPRVCGGTVGSFSARRRNRGLSPRVRGNRAQHLRGVEHIGSIPACAGEPPRAAGRGAAPRVYPRVCGGTRPQPARPRDSRGLSPRVRGNRQHGVLDGGRLGSIPACAGEPRPARSSARPAGVYPRVCGGTDRIAVRSSGARGLSPRVRGNRRLSGGQRPAPGSIPACAGEPAAKQSSQLRARVYPRVCGGTSMSAHRSFRALGLSPRVRGNRMRRPIRGAGRGSIPACAGEPEDFSGLAALPTVYPRVCGGTRSRHSAPEDVQGLSPRVRGNPIAAAPAISDTGLSPRVRGNRPAVASFGAGHGSIPACAGEPRPTPGAASPARVYPRVCGGTATRISPAPATTGLSPRVRGNLDHAALGVGQRGSIPACAGEPQTRASRARWRRVYPRVCGGTVCQPSSTSPPTGLSPRVRGNHARGDPGPHRAGSIPACAGEPRSMPPTPSSARVYPRVCGGTDGTTLETFRQDGLSPRVRGNRGRVVGHELVERSIPACAGEPSTWARPPHSGGVYPRVCGGTLYLGTTTALWWGLSPRVRGNHRDVEQGQPLKGSIPACAGEPSGAGRPARPRGVYPRVCGGTRSFRFLPLDVRGLSPRVRGNLGRAGRPWRQCGSIPACAGEPRRRPAASATSWVYPRVCGGTSRMASPSRCASGLSPRVRGNLARHGLQRHGEGSIPACAGEPSGAHSGAAATRVYPRVCGGTAGQPPPSMGETGLSPRVRGNRAALRAAAAGPGSIPACAGEPRPFPSSLPRPAVYPRVCGGTTAPYTFRHWAEGLSPRVRGNHVQHRALLDAEGSIPACAGEPIGASI